MADRPKAKVAKGVRNDDRKNGKAWKKHPKTPRRKGNKWADVKEARRVRRIPLAEVHAEKQSRLATRIQRELADKETQRKREVKRKSAKVMSPTAKRNAEMISAMKAGKDPR